MTADYFKANWHLSELKVNIIHHFNNVAASGWRIPRANESVSLLLKNPGNDIML